MAKNPSNTETSVKPDDAKLRMLRAQQINIAFSQIVTLMMRSQRFRHVFLAELEWLLAPGVATGQFLITETKSSENGFPTPIAAVLWATVSEDVNTRLTNNGVKPQLKPGEWASGNIPWLIETVGEPNAAGALVKKLAEETFAQVGLRVMERQADGKMLVRVLGKPTAQSTTGTNAPN